ncbi:aldehyde dehydrogenase [Nitrospirillum sp. BR 11164]|uniref:aldehyde dehydrogenase n=1 Tax=Nitrospirillum sp. BR 11164 TaxID=3104324 RepID=UPI002B002CB4|nr:aldehyde dehydrogenase [Nitrospirillum sp. BR 11164]MEA1652889.1 aldehyde dehydrogenase [Nitrospirillum sp. BR 11164]
MPPSTLVNLSHPDRLFIGGEWVSPLSSAALDIVSPSTEQLVGRVAEAGPADMDRAVAAARHAFDTGPWPRMTGPERAKILTAIADRLEARADDFAHAWALQVGIPLPQAQASARMARGYFDYYADLAAQGFEEVRTPARGGACVVVREPVGVAAAVVPWNAPLATLLLKVAPALAAGCAVIAKPAPETPLEALLLAECAAAAGLPAGVLSVVPSNREAADHLIRHDGVDKVSFTGSTAAGRHIAAVCAGRMTRIAMELGGKSAAIVLEDAPVETVLSGVLPTLIGLCGQQCAAFSRILVPRRRLADITEAMAAAFQAVQVGDPFTAGTQMGPLVAKRQMERVQGYIDQGQHDGATLVTGGGRPAHLDRGWFVAPTLFTGVDNTMPLAREEIFGPVGSIIAYDSEEQAIAIANDSPYGLSGGVFTQDTDRAYAIARRVRTGNFTQNGRVIDYTMPYGGFKQSGLGREGGIEGLHGFTEVKAVFLPHVPAHLAPSHLASR